MRISAAPLPILRTPPTDRGIIMRQITTAGGNLFRIAMEHLGDATQWIRIAQLNNIADPWIDGVYVLYLPPADPDAGGGIVAQ